MTDLFGEEGWVNWLFQTALLAGLFLLAWLLLGRHVSVANKRWFVVINAIVLTVFSICFSATYPFLLSTQATLMSTLHRLENRLHQRQNVVRTMGNNRLWLVDVSHDVSLIDDAAMTPTWGSKQVITDRHKLAWLLNALGHDSLKNQVDLVVCDLTFGSAADPAHDDTLRQALVRLDTLDKLLIARSRLNENKEIDGSSVIDADSMTGGLVDIATYFGGNFYSYPLFERTDSSGRQYSLGYNMYRKLAGIYLPETMWWQPYVEVDTNGYSSLITRQFIPDYLVDDTDLTTDTEDSTLEAADAHRLLPYYFRLGQLVAHGYANDTLSAGYNPASLAPLAEQLRLNHDKKLRNVVFIGIFDGKERDMHMTAVGSMHGSMILINVLLNLLQGTHHISVAYILILLVGFLITSYWMVHPFREIELDLLKEQPEYPKRRIRWWAKRWIQKTVNWVLSERAYLAALVLMIGAIVTFNHLINVAVVELYLILMSLALEGVKTLKLANERSRKATDQSSYQAQA